MRMRFQAVCVVVGLALSSACATKKFVVDQVALERDARLLTQAPIGTIIPYWGNVQDIPRSWVVCDGSTVNDAASPLNGRVLPNLKDNRFLMGVTGSTLQELEVPAMRGGNNDIPLDGNAEVTTSTVEAHNHPGSVATRDLTKLPFNAGTEFRTTGSPTNDHQHPVTVAPDGRHSHTVTPSGHRHGGENRPLYQGVYYIIRIK